MEQYCIHAVPDAPEVRLIYIKGMHSVNSWRSEVNLSQCKINLFVEGHSYIIINGKSHVANAGDILLYRPHDIHYGDIPYEQMIEYFELLFEPAALACLTGGDALVRLFAERVPEQQPIVLLRPDAERLKSLNESFYRLLNCLRKNPAHGNLMALSMLLEILCAIHACREYAAPLQSASFYPTPLMAALDYINGHFQESITNATISGVAAVSPSYLNRLFRKYLHCTPHAYLLSRRMAYARQLPCPGCFRYGNMLYGRISGQCLLCGNFQTHHGAYPFALSAKQFRKRQKLICIPQRRRTRHSVDAAFFCKFFWLFPNSHFPQAVIALLVPEVASHGKKHRPFLVKEPEMQCVCAGGQIPGAQADSFLHGLAVHPAAIVRAFPVQPEFVAVLVSGDDARFIKVICGRESPVADVQGEHRVGSAA